MAVDMQMAGRACANSDISNSNPFSIFMFQLKTACFNAMAQQNIDSASKISLRRSRRIWLTLLTELLQNAIDASEQFLSMLVKATSKLIYLKQSPSVIGYTCNRESDKDLEPLEPEPQPKSGC